MKFESEPRDDNAFVVTEVVFPSDQDQPVAVPVAEADTDLANDLFDVDDAMMDILSSMI